MFSSSAYEKIIKDTKRADNFKARLLYLCIVPEKDRVVITTLKIIVIIIKNFKTKIKNNKKKFTKTLKPDNKNYVSRCFYRLLSNKQPYIPRVFFISPPSFFWRESLLSFPHPAN